MTTIKLRDNNEDIGNNYIITPMSAQDVYISKDEAEDNGLTFSPVTDTSKAKAVAITDAYASTIFSAVSYSPLVTLDASGRNNAINLVGNSNKNKIIGGSGADTFTGGEGNDTFIGGEGADTFISSDGKNVIDDYNASQGDVIMLNNVTPTKVSVSKQKVIITNSDKSTFTINNGKEQNLKVIDNKGNIIEKVSQAFGATELTADSSTDVIDATLNTSVKTINGANANNVNLIITGNSKANSIVGSDYVDNTLIGGAGNDTLTGGDMHTIMASEVLSSGGINEFISTVQVHNTFIFAEGQGTNVITNYRSSTDAILLSSGSVLSYTTKKDDIVFTIALDGKKKSTITVKNGRNKLITFLKPDGTINTANTMIYRISQYMNQRGFYFFNNLFISTSFFSFNFKIYIFAFFGSNITYHTRKRIEHS